jgi:hypothetical protein
MDANEIIKRRQAAEVVPEGLDSSDSEKDGNATIQTENKSYQSHQNTIFDAHSKSHINNKLDGLYPGLDSMSHMSKRQTEPTSAALPPMVPATQNPDQMHQMTQMFTMFQ